MSPKNIIITVLAIASLVEGAISQHFFPGQLFPPPALVLGVVGTLLIFLWYRLDSDQRRYRRSVFLNVGVIGLPIIALPYYFFRAQGAKRGVVATALMLLAFVASSLLGYVGALAVYYGLHS